MRIVVATALLFGVTAAQAAEPSGCDKFKWPIARERAALTMPERALVRSGGDLAPTGGAVTLALAPSGDAKLPTPPERSFPPETFAGFVRVAAPQQAGNYTISLSDALWVDVVQDGKMLKPSAFSGATDCDGIRKTLRFDLAATSLVIQFGGGKTDRVNLLLSPTHSH